MKFLSDNKYKVIVQLFLLIAFIQSIFSGLKFGCWWGFVILIVGLIIGFIYEKFKKNKSISN